MSSVAENIGAAPRTGGEQRVAGRAWYQTEDSWAIIIGVGLVVIAVLAVLAGSSINWLAVAPGSWNSPGEILQQLGANGARYAALFLLWLALFGVSTPALGIRPAQFVPAFALLFVVAAFVIFVGAWTQANRYNLEPPLVALALGLAVSNTVGLPRWLDAGFRVEYYIKVGIVLLGATLPLTLLVSAGPVAIAQAAVVSLVTFGVIYFVGVRLGLDRRFAATLGAGGAVCGVSAAIAVSGAVGAKREHGPVAITIVIFWAIVMIFVLPLAARALGLPTGVAGAWIGTSEFADAAGFAAAQAYGGYAGHVPGIAGTPEAAINAFTLMKVIGRDLWIGIWAFVLSVIAVSRWDATGIDSRAGAGQIWQRFPKFVIGFVLASALITLLAAAYGPAAFNKVLKPEVVAPIKTLRTWAFTFCFLSIGLTLRWRELAGVGLRPFIAFSSGVVVNVLLGFLLSAVVFGGYWAALGAP